MIRRILSIGYKQSRFLAHSRYLLNSLNKPDQIEITEDDLQAIKQIFQNGNEFSQNIATQLKVDSPILIEDVFVEREQLISFKLMSFQDVEQIMQFYFSELDKQNIEKEKNPPFTPSEFSLFFYFISGLRSMPTFPNSIQKHISSVENIINHIIDGCSQIDANQFSAFLFALGTFSFELEIEITLLDRQKYLILTTASKNMDLLTPEQICATVFALSTIFRTNNTSDVQECLLKLVAQVQRNIHLVPPQQLVVLTHSLPLKSAVAARPLFNYILECVDNDQLDINETSQIAKQLIVIQEYTNSPVLGEMIKAIEKQLDNKQTLGLSHAIHLLEQFVNVINIYNIQYIIYIYIQLDEAKNYESFIKRLLRIIHNQQDSINITDYITLLLSLVRVRMIGFDYEKTIEVAKRVLEKSSVFKIQDLQDEEVVNILVYLAALRVDDREFVGRFIGLIKPQNQSRIELIKLALSLVVYVRQFEDFYIQIHQACVQRIFEFNPIEKEKLSKVFGRTRILFPDSPFIVR